MTENIVLPPEVQELLDKGEAGYKAPPPPSPAGAGHPASKEEYYLHLLEMKDWTERKRLAALWIGTGIIEARKIDPKYGRSVRTGTPDLFVGKAKYMLRRGWRPGLPLSHRGATEPC